MVSQWLLIILIVIILYIIKVLNKKIISYFNLLSNVILTIVNNWVTYLVPHISDRGNEPEWYGRFSCLFTMSSNEYLYD